MGQHLIIVSHNQEDHEIMTRMIMVIALQMGRGLVMMIIRMRMTRVMIKMSNINYLLTDSVPSSMVKDDFSSVFLHLLLPPLLSQ